MNPSKFYPLFFGLAIAVICSCNKNHDTTGSTPPPQTTPRQILYLVKGTKFNMNYIDSNNNFLQNVTFQDSFRYSFNKGAGGNIGMSISLYSPTDTIDSWELYIDGKLYANAFSEGGVYMVVPYTLN